MVGAPRRCGSQAVSTHAPARGATGVARVAVWRFMLFRPTLPRGERPDRDRHERCLDGVSTHAPARGATPTTGTLLCAALSFDPRSREGSDELFAVDPYRKQNFDPRSREGSDWSRRSPGARRRSFDPRSREGSDRSTVVTLSASSSFRPTLPRGERRAWPRCRPGPSSVSIHAPARGATWRGMGLAGALYQVSIHAPARGATIPLLSTRAFVGFRSTLPRGERQPGRSCCRAVRCFDPRSREGSDHI